MAGKQQVSSQLALDLRVGGHGDNWMRLCGLYTAAALRPDLTIVCTVPASLQELAQKVFSDRLEVRATATDGALIFTNLGLRHLLARALKGTRFVVPYHRTVVVDWGVWALKDWINVNAFSFFNLVGWTQLPPWPALKRYQGYCEVVSIAKLRDISWNEFLGAAEADFELIFTKLNAVSNELVSADFSVVVDAVAVFPSGTAHQYMPVEWAAKHLPQAVFCFHESDRDRRIFEERGLKVITFNRAADIVAISQRAKLSVATDSFPSHLLQFASERSLIILAEFPKERIVSPFFRGSIIDSAAPCSPCPHLERGTFPLCKAGQPACLTWGYADVAAKLALALG